MSNEILVPSLGESISEATVSKWLKEVGDTVDSDEPVVELETDKVNIEVPSPFQGTLSSIIVKEGSTVEVGSLLGVIKNEKSSSSISSEENSSTQIIEKNEQKEKIKKKDKLKFVEENLKMDESEEPLILENLAENESIQKTSSEESVKSKYVPPRKVKNLSPAVRKIVSENNIDIESVTGTGKSGRVSKGDLVEVMGNMPEPSKRNITHGPEERVKMTRLRITIAKRLKEAQEKAAILTTFNEVNVQNVIQMKKDYQEDFQKKYSVKLGFMSFFVKASVVALKNFPSVNAEIENDHIVYKNYYNISIAIGTDRGLVVPVLRKADELSFADIEKNIFLLSEKAKKGKITINDLQGGTFTISNGGIYGSMLSTPILNPPQTGILGMHNIVNRAVVENNNIVVRPIMYLALSYDHRIIDGKEAVSFLKTIKECLEEPRRLFLDL